MATWVVSALIGGVGVLQLPLIVDLVLALVPAARGNVHRMTHRAMSVALIGVVGIVSLAAIAYFYTIFLHRIGDEGGAAWLGAGGIRLLHATFITAVWLLTLDNYACCCLTRPPAEDLRAKRVHGFDHYCPFTMNLVFQSNYRQFFHFLLLATVGMLYACAVSWPPFFQCWVRPVLEEEQALQQQQAHVGVPCAEPAHVSLIFLPAMLLLTGVGALLACQVWLFVTNKTTATFFKEAQEKGLLTAMFQRHTTQPTKYNRYMTHWAGPASVFLPPSLFG